MLVAAGEEGNGCWSYGWLTVVLQSPLLLCTSDAMPAVPA